MFNVLPEKLKKEIIRDYKLHRWFLILLAIFLLQITFLIFFLPSWANSYFKEKEISAQISVISNSEDFQNADAIFSIIDSTNIKLRLINSNLAYPKLVPIINAIIANKTSAIRIGQLSFASSDSASAVISISGISATRDALIAYTDTLEKTKMFSSVDLPISSLVEDKDLNFSLDLKISK